MMSDHQPPLILFMDNTNGEEVALRVEPEDDFQTFLSNAKATLGYEVDINSITRNQPVSLNDNIYQFLITADRNLASQLIPIQEPMKTLDQMLEPTNEANDLVYILDDGTQIRASQIHFDNDDPQVDLTAEKIPFVKYIDDGADDFDLENVGEEEIRKFNIAKSPDPNWSSKESSPKCSFVNTLPFKLVCNNTSVFEAQFNKYLESSAAKTYTTLNPVTNRNKSPRSLIKENYKSYDDKFSRGDDFTGYTREDILNMFKDSPVTSLPYEGQSMNEKRRHVRKTDPSRGVHKNWNSKPVNYDDGILIGDTENQNCFICGKFVENNIDKLYLFDNEDQKLHRSSPQKKSSRQLKIICENCLGENFKPCRMKGPNQCLNPDEYLVIRNNQQYIFQKTNKIVFKTNNYNDSDINKDSKKRGQEKEKVEFVKVEIGSDGEIVTKPIDNDPRSSDDVIIVKDEDKDGSSSDVEIVEPPEIDENIIDNLEDADEEVKQFLGKYQRSVNTEIELKCRFCERVFADLSEVMDHVDEHRHDTEDGSVYPCSLCDYGYANSKWLKGHIKAAHERPNKMAPVGEDNIETEKTSTTTSPIAKRTRSSIKKSEDGDKESPTKPNEEKAQIVTNSESAEMTLTIKTEVKQEAVESSDDEIWIVQTGDVETDQIHTLLHAANKGCVSDKADGEGKSNNCVNCGQLFTPEDDESSHKCKSRRAKKRKPGSNEDNGICVPTQEDFIKRAQGRPRTSTSYAENSDNDLLVVRPRRKKNKEPSSDPQIVTCHDCNESFTSKVRLKFHMQFHSPSRQGIDRYSCGSCSGLRFSTETELFDHVHFRHDKHKRWQCPVARCGKTFHLRATLTKHSRTHTDTRRYVCVTCGKRFLDKQTLDEHGVTHLQIKPFQCHICMKQLTRRSRLRMHLRAHEEELTLTLVLVCAVCSRAFRDRDDAQEHAIKSTECLEEFAKDLKEETEETEAQLSPTSGLVRQPEQAEREKRASSSIPRQATGSASEALLCSLPDTARSVIRVVEIEKAFRCEYCEDVFYLEDGLNAHRAIHKGVKNPFTCHICKVSFATYSRCTTHKTTHGFYKRSLAEVKKNATRPSETEAGPSATGILGYGGFPVVKHFLCEKPQLYTTDSYKLMSYQLERRVSSSIPRQATGAASEALLSSLPDAARSVIRVVEIEKAFRCEYCEDVFYLEDGLNAHRAIHKGVKNPFTCHICKVSFATYSRCTTHKTTHGFYKRSLAEVKKNATRPSETEAGPSATGILGYGGFPVVKHFLCEDCGRSYLHWTYLQVHRRMKHANDNLLHKCNHCDITFPNSWSLAYHRKKIHGQGGQGDANASKTGEGHRIPCRDCDEVLPNKTALYKHRKKEHSDMTRINNKPNSLWCVPCGSQFSTREERDAHAATHAVPLAQGECTKCGDGYHQAGEEKQCDAQCLRRSHTCPVCAHSFRSASVRDEHLRTHTGERPYPCDLCGLAFRRSTAMRNHRLIHTGVRAWACARCPKRFRIRSDLRTHARLKHPAHLAVVEILGLNPSPDEVMECLAANNIAHDKVIEITKMSFAKGTTSVIPTCARALSILGDVPRTQVAYSKPVTDDKEFQPPRRGRGIAKNLRRPKTDGTEGDEEPTQDSNPYPITINVTGGELSGAEAQLLVQHGALLQLTHPLLQPRPAN